MELMAAQVGFEKISKLLNKKGTERLSVTDDITAGIHSAIDKLNGSTCINLIFLETIQKESWSEYYLLLRFPKIENHIKYLCREFRDLSTFLEEFDKIVDFDKSRITSIGLEEIDTTQPDFYYTLLYIIRDDERETK